MSDTDALINGLEQADPERIIAELDALDRRIRALKILLRAARSRKGDQPVRPSEKRKEGKR